MNCDGIYSYYLRNLTFAQELALIGALIAADVANVIFG
jgi:hypothetical protein